MADESGYDYSPVVKLDITERLVILESKVDRILAIMETVGATVNGFGEQVSKSPFLGKMLGL